MRIIIPEEAKNLVDAIQDLLFVYRTDHGRDPDAIELTGKQVDALLATTTGWEYLLIKGGITYIFGVPLEVKA